MTDDQIVTPALLDWEHAAAYLSTTPRHLKALVARRAVTFVRVGKLIRFRRVDLDAYADSHKVEARS